MIIREHSIIRKFVYMLITAIFVLSVPRFSVASGSLAKVTYKDGSNQVFHLNRSASTIRRVMFDKDKSRDRLVVTYRDDTHQVFVLKKSIAKVKRLVFEGGDKGHVSKNPPARTFDAGRMAARLPVNAELGQVWKVTENCGGLIWTATWTRRGSSNIFDAYWTSNTGGKFTGIVEFAGISDSTVKLYRNDKNGYYEVTLSQDRKRAINGWATWYPPNCMPWYAVIE